MEKNAVLSYDLIVIGGGAAGFYGALQAAETHPGLRILILEKTPKLLSKVKVSGGGRCNVTHHCFEPGPLAKHYPRGEKLLKQLFKSYQATDTVAWFEKHGVGLKTEADGRMFPESNSSDTIIRCFLGLADTFGIQIMTGEEVTALAKKGGNFLVTTRKATYTSSFILAATGGAPKAESYSLWKSTGHTLVPPVPSLFTFNDTAKQFADLSGIAVGMATVKIAGTKHEESGPLLITHWGLSGPAVIRLSAWAAEALHQCDYTFTALVNWTGTMGEEDLRKHLTDYKQNHGKRQIQNHPLFGLPQRLWTRLCQLADIPEGLPWAELPKKSHNRLIEHLLRCPFNIKGKTTFKEEFVTCGGIPLSEIDAQTMESKKMDGLYFAGELLHIDGITGGFNFQAAWTTSAIAAKAIAQRQSLLKTY
jgi:predicted Rossmann fold flavoprotein